MAINFTLKMISKTFLAFVLIAGTAGQAHAGKVKKTLKLSDEAATLMVKMGNSAKSAPARAALKGAGGGLKKTNKVARVFTGGVTGVVAGTVVGGAVLNTLDKIGAEQDRAVNRVYKGCNNAVCGTAKDVTKFLLPF